MGEGEGEGTGEGKGEVLQYPTEVEGDLECALHTLADRWAPAEVAEGESATRGGAGAQLLRVDERGHTGGDPVVPGREVAITSKPMVGAIKVGLLGVSMPRVARHVGGTRLATTEGPIVVRVMEVAERGLEPTAARRVARGGHPSVPLARKNRLVPSSAHEASHPGHVDRDAGEAGDRVCRVEHGRIEIVDVHVHRVATRYQSRAGWRAEFERVISGQPDAVIHDLVDARRVNRVRWCRALEIELCKPEIVGEQHE